MTVKELKMMLDKFSEDTEIYIDKPDVVYMGDWDGSVNRVVSVQKKNVHPKKLKSARRPCKETEGCKTSLVIYVE